MNKVKNLGYNRRLMFKQPRQESGLCCFSFARYLQSAHALGITDVCVFVDFGQTSGIIFLVFRKLLPTSGNRLPDQLCYPDKFNHSHQITQSEKMLIIATRRSRIGNCIFQQVCRSLVQKSIFLRNYGQKIIILSCRIIETFLFDMYFNWQPKRPIFSSFDC